MPGGGGVVFLSNLAVLRLLRSMAFRPCFATSLAKSNVVFLSSRVQYHLNKNKPLNLSMLLILKKGYSNKMISK
ncbi:hypothetical protein THMIRHAM_04310 [Thiomicrorhabdus immobilis]|uniref:Secreted protein n=1 Tax=Thiomicrorhabdus immobilis TaxID=2791037 RepID=A0ABM7MBC8_9GAMM|nr:hypothetical protein THMIRHAM_04310 [Thiomicrorhabdus immobilis]